MTRKTILLDLSQATGINTTPLNIKLSEDRVIHFEIPERTDVDRARMVAQLERLTNDDETRAVAVEWLLECADTDVTRAEAASAVRQTSALAQILTVLLTGRQTDPKVMDRLLSKLMDKLTAEILEAI